MLRDSNSGQDAIASPEMKNAPAVLANSGYDLPRCAYARADWLGLHLRRLHHCALCQRHNRSPVRRVRCQHTKVAVAMRARGWHQGCNARDQLQWRACDFIDLCAPLVVGFADRLAMLFGTAAHQYTARFAQPVQRKRWPCAVAQQTLQAGAVMRCYANAGVYRKTAVALSQHLFWVFRSNVTSDSGRT